MRAGIQDAQPIAIENGDHRLRCAEACASTRSTNASARRPPRSRTRSRRGSAPRRASCCAPHDFDKADAFRPANGEPVDADERRTAEPDEDEHDRPERARRRARCAAARLRRAARGRARRRGHRRAPAGLRTEDDHDEPEPDGHAQAGATDAGRHAGRAGGAREHDDRRDRRRRGRARDGDRRRRAARDQDRSRASSIPTTSRRSKTSSSRPSSRRRARPRSCRPRSSARSTGGIDLGSMLGGLGGSLEPVNVYEGVMQTLIDELGRLPGDRAEVGATHRVLSPEGRRARRQAPGARDRGCQGPRHVVPALLQHLRGRALRVLSRRTARQPRRVRRRGAARHRGGRTHR